MIELWNKTARLICQQDFIGVDLVYSLLKKYFLVNSVDLFHKPVLMIRKRKTKLTEKQIINYLQTGDEEKACRALYPQIAPMVERFTYAAGGTKEEASDLTSKALEALIENVRRGKYQYRSAITTYLMGIVKILWLKKIGATPEPIVELNPEITAALEDEITDMEAEKEADEAYFEQNKIVQECLNKMDKKGQQVLEAFYFDRKKDKETAKLFGYKSANVVKASRAKYLKTLRECVKGKLQNRK